MKTWQNKKQVFNNLIKGRIDIVDTLDHILYLSIF